MNDTGRSNAVEADVETPDAAVRADDVASTVDAKHPWLGLASFTEETRAYFHGREDEVAELARRVQRKLLTILFGQSGLGKTSILRAGIVPRLRPEGYCPIYVRIDYSRDSPAPSEQIKDAIFRATRSSGHWTQPGVAIEGESLWEFLHHRDDVLRDANGRTLTPLLIFDQFEEIFTLAQGDDFGRSRAAQFLEDLADLIENRAPKALEARLEADDSAIERFDFTRADYRVLIALREDYLAHLEGLKAAMPSITQNRMRLARMTGEQALDAVMKPGGRLVSQEVAEAIVRFIAGGAEIRNAEVEPALLSLICRELNNVRIAQRRDEISADVLAGSRETILAEFYERALGDQPQGVRQVVEDHLLTDSGYREMLAEERLERLLGAAGAPPGTLATLVNRRLLRVEERLDLRRVELTHDVLCGVVKASRDIRLEREARDEAERRLEAQRARERATRQALARTRKIAAGCAILAIAAIASAIYGWMSTRRAEQAEANAQQTRQLAETARGEAEKLVVYLLDDFNLELAPIGRLDILSGLAKRAVDYYDGLPAALRTTETDRNRALALVRYGSALRTQGRFEDSRKAIDDAVAVLTRLRDGGDKSDVTTIGLALGLTTQARIISAVTDEVGGLATSTHAAEAIQPAATAPGASVALRRAHGEVMLVNGFLEMRNARYQEAVGKLDESRAAFRTIDNDASADLPAAAGYAEATAWQVEAFANLARVDDARRAAKEAVATTTRVLQKQPGNLYALRAQALAVSPLSFYLSGEMRLREALENNETAMRTWNEYLRFDPGNIVSWHNLAVGYYIRADILEREGRLADAVASIRAALDTDAKATPNVMGRANLTNHAGRLAELEAERGNRNEAEAALALQAKLNAWVSERLPPDSFEAKLYRHSGDWWRAISEQQLGDLRPALEHGRTLVPKLENIMPDNPARYMPFGNSLTSTYLWLAQTAYALDDAASAERFATRGLEVRKLFGIVDLGDKRMIANLQGIRSLALAKLGRTQEAQAQAAAALKTHRDIAALKRDDPSHAFDLATALYAAAVVGKTNQGAMLAEAATLMDRLPPETQHTAYARMWHDRIAAERAARR